MRIEPEEVLWRLEFFSGVKVKLDAKSLFRFDASPIGDVERMVSASYTLSLLSRKEVELSLNDTV